MSVTWEREVFYSRHLYNCRVKPFTVLYSQSSVEGNVNQGNRGRVCLRRLRCSKQSTLEIEPAAAAKRSQHGLRDRMLL